MPSRKDLDSAEPDTHPTMVITANGEMQTEDETPVYVYDLDLFVTLQILEDTPAVLLLG